MMSKPKFCLYCNAHVERTWSWKEETEDYYVVHWWARCKNSHKWEYAVDRYYKEKKENTDEDI